MNEELIVKILSINGPSSFEDSATSVWAKEAEKYADKVYQDVNGNCFAHLNGNVNDTIMVTAHIDEIGLMVRSIDKDGFIRFLGIGGWDSQILQGQRVRILDESGKTITNGVIGKQAIHLLSDEDRKKVAKLEDLWIDIGAKSKEEAESMVSIGDPIVLDVVPIILNNGLFVSRACDNRVGTIILLETLRKIYDSKKNLVGTLFPSVVFVTTVKEEIGMISHGAATASYSLNPNSAICIDATFATDHPSTDEKMARIELDGGPVISRGNVSDKKMVASIRSIAKHSSDMPEIKVQLKSTPSYSSTDSDNIQATRNGIPTVLISFPLRYMHTPCEVVSPKDIDATAELIARYISNKYKEVIKKGESEGIR